MDAAAGELRDVLGLEHDIPTVDPVDAERFLDLVDVEADADRAPHVVDRVFVAGIVFCGALAHHVPHIDEVRQLRLVELLEHACLDLARQEVGGRHDDVVAAAAGEQLGLQDFVGIEDVVDDLDAGFLGEILDDRLVDVIRPVVDVDDAILCTRTSDERRQNGRGCGQPERFADHAFLLFIDLLRRAMHGRAAAGELARTSATSSGWPVRLRSIEADRCASRKRGNLRE